MKVFLDAELIFELDIDSLSVPIGTNALQLLEADSRFVDVIKNNPKLEKRFVDANLFLKRIQ